MSWPVFRTWNVSDASRWLLNLESMPPLPAPGEALNFDDLQRISTGDSASPTAVQFANRHLERGGFYRIGRIRMAGNRGTASSKFSGLSAVSGRAYEGLLESRPELAGHAELLLTCVRALPAILQGKQAATEVMFPGGSLRLVEKIYKGTTADRLFQSSDRFCDRTCRCPAAPRNCRRRPRFASSKLVPVQAARLSQ